MKLLFCTVAAIAVAASQGVSAQPNGQERHGNGHAQHTTTTRQTAHVQAQVRQQGPANGGAQNVRVNRSTTVNAAPRGNRATRTTNVNAAPTVTTREARGSAGRVNAQTRVQRAPGYRPAQVQRVHASRFNYPRGYSYRRWSIGSILPSIFLSPSYYYTDWYDLGFGPPPRHYAWVRYGPDLLLVNTRTGRIRQVVPNVFY